MVGGGNAAVTAAEAIRKCDDTGTITMIDAEETLPVNRPQLSRNLAVSGRYPETILIHPAGWYEENRIDLRPGTELSSFDPAEKKARLADGTVLPYDRLIYACGAECFVPPLKGRDLDGVLRHLSDAEEILSRVTPARQAVVIGGGVLGLVAAAELKKPAWR